MIINSKTVTAISIIEHRTHVSAFLYLSRLKRNISRKYIAEKLKKTPKMVHYYETDLKFVNKPVFEAYEVSSDDYPDFYPGKLTQKDCESVLSEVYGFNENQAELYYMLKFYKISNEEASKLLGVTRQAVKYLMMDPKTQVKKEYLEIIRNFTR